jgi:hypothetical protein
MRLSGIDLLPIPGIASLAETASRDMKNYEAFDIASHCNAGLAWLEEHCDGSSPLLGRQTLQGLPFIVGGEEADPSR